MRQNCKNFLHLFNKKAHLKWKVHFRNSILFLTYLYKACGNLFNSKQIICFIFFYFATTNVLCASESKNDEANNQIQYNFGHYSQSINFAWSSLDTQSTTTLILGGNANSISAKINSEYLNIFSNINFPNIPIPYINPYVNPFDYRKAPLTPLEIQNYISDYQKKFQQFHTKKLNQAKDIIFKILMAMHYMPIFMQHNPINDPYIHELYNVLKSKNANADNLMQIFISFISLGTNKEFTLFGKENNLLAINDGRKIMFNLDLLIQKKLDFPQIFALLFHEISHFDTNNPISSKDITKQKLENFMRQKEYKIQTTADTVYYFYDFGIKFRLPEKIYIVTGLTNTESKYSEYLKHLENTFISFFETQNLTNSECSLYNPFDSKQILMDAFGSGPYIHSISAPEISQILFDPKKNKIRLRYKLNNWFYVTDYNNGNSSLLIPNATPFDTYLPNKQYEIGFSADKSTSTNNHKYDEVMASASFKLKRISNYGESKSLLEKNRRFVDFIITFNESDLYTKSFREKAQKIINPLHIYLKTKNINSEKIFFYATEFSWINSHQLIARFEIPNAPLTASEIFIGTQKSNQLKYEQVKIQSSKKISIPANPTITNAITPLVSNPRATEIGNDMYRFTFNTPKKIKSLTVERRFQIILSNLEVVQEPWQHRVIPEQKDTDDSRSIHIELVNIDDSGIISQKQENSNHSSVQIIDLKIPKNEGVIKNQTRGHNYSRKITWAYTQNYKSYYVVAQKGKNYLITGAILHFEDGTSEYVHFNKIETPDQNKTELQTNKLQSCENIYKK